MPGGGSPTYIGLDPRGDAADAGRGAPVQGEAEKWKISYFLGVQSGRLVHTAADSVDWEARSTDGNL